MARDQNELIQEFSQNLKILYSRYADIKGDKQQLLNENNELKSLVQKLEEKIQDLKSDNNKLKLSGAVMASSDSQQDAKAKVNRIVREIDNCIALLNR
ncbi:hypothetical protein ACFLRG_01165 [Bacteroidota bacterium]